MHRWFRLSDLEALGNNYIPIFPVLDPFTLEAVLTMPNTGLFGLPFDVYKTYGKILIQLLMRVIAQAKAPHAHQASLEQKVAELLPEGTLGKLIANKSISKMIASSPFILQNWVPPGVVTSLHAEKNPTDQAVDLDHVAEALVGAYAHSEGGFF